MDAIERMKFEKEASPEAIRYEIKLAQEGRDRAEKRLLWLFELLEKKLGRSSGKCRATVIEKGKILDCILEEGHEGHHHGELRGGMFEWWTLGPAVKVK